MKQWIALHETELWWALAGSTATLLVTIIGVPLLLISLPADYFVPGKRRRVLLADWHPLVRIVMLVVKNLLGGVFLLAGAAMLVLPGQGLLTIAAGVLLVDFPGKFRMERKIISYRPVLRSVNWLRRRADRQPFDLGCVTKSMRER